MITEIQKQAVSAIINAIQTGSNLVISSNPGSGKTYVIEQTSKLYTGTKRIVALAYNRKAADELQDRCDTSAVYANTFHSVGLRILYGLRSDIDKKDYIHINYAKSILGYHETNDKKEKSLLKLIARRSADLADRSKEMLSDDFMGLIAEFEIKTVWGKQDHTQQIIQTAQAIVDSTVSRFENSGKLTFTDMIYLPVAMGLTNPYDVVIIDESQDTTPLKIEFVQSCLNPDSLILVGDSKQAINLWLGAIPDLLESVGFQTKKLNETHRNGVNGCHYVEQQFDVEHKPASHVKKDDIVAHVESLQSLVEHMPHGLILSRKNADLVPTWHTLIQSGHTAYIAGDAGLAFSIINAVSNYDDLDAMVESGSVDVDIAETTRAIVKNAGDKKQALQFVSKMLGMPVCDKCGNGMLLRSGKYGLFYGCGNYPKCKNTRKYGEDDKPIVDFTLSTVHKQKGSTWKHVALLPNLSGIGETVEETNIRFVASTRQTDSLFLVGFDA